MDHLQHPRDADLPPVAVPYYSKYKYDGGRFTDFPTRCGFDKTEWIFGDFRSIPSDEHDAFFQAWLYFGLLHEFFGGVDYSVFVNQEQQRITTAALPRLAQIWQRNLPAFSRTRKLATFQKVNSCLKEVRDMVTHLDDRFDRTSTFPDGSQVHTASSTNLSAEVALSIIVLGLTLEEVRSTVLGGWPPSRWAKARLEAAGWCKAESSRLEKFIFATGMVYCGSMPNIGRDIDHSACSESRCSAEDIDAKTYFTKHAQYPDTPALRKRSCARADLCEDIGPSINDLASVLEAGNYPVLALSKKEGSSVVQMRVHPYRKSTKYTAITHIWADGLGNPKANVLPKCQIDRLHYFLTALEDHKEGLSLTRAAWSSFMKEEGTVYIWIDTLCIPLAKHLRKKAINFMYDVYNNATNVLLLDESLLYLTSTERPLEELGFRITTSPWMRRAWTLQEGALARRLFIQLADGPLHVETLIEKLVERTKGSESYNITFLESCISLSYLKRCGDKKDDAQLVFVQTGLQDRSTSHIKDKELCLAIMLRYDMQAIQEAEGDLRTQKIYEQLDFIPSSFFWHQGMCLDVSGFRWAPKDMYSTRAFGKDTRDRLSMKNGRLLVGAPGMVIRGRSHYFTKWTFHVRDVKPGLWYALRWHALDEFKGIDSRSQTGWTVLAIILQKASLSAPIQPGVVISLDWAVNAGSIDQISTEGHKRKAVEGVFIGRANFETLDEKDTRYLSAQKEKQKDIEAKRDAIRAGREPVPEDANAFLRTILLEDDDSWWVFDGEMLGPQTVWSVE